MPRDEYIVFSADVRDRPVGTRLEWEVKNWGVDDYSHHNERYGKSESTGRFDLEMSRNDGEHEWTRHTSYTGRHECVVKLIDPLSGRTVTSERFVVHVGRPRSRYMRRLGRTR